MAEKTISDASIAELIKNLRIVKRQLKIMKGMPFTKEQKELIHKAVDEIKAEIEIFKI